MLEILEVATADHTGQLKKRQKAPKRLVFNLLPLTGFHLAAGQGRSHRASKTPQGWDAEPGLSAKTQGQH